MDGPENGSSRPSGALPTPSGPEGSSQDRLALLGASLSARRKERATSAVKRHDRAAQSRQNLQGKVLAPSVRHRLDRLRAAWEESQRTWDPDGLLEAWGPGERGKLTQLLELYTDEVVEAAVRYFAGAWPQLQKRIFSGRETSPTVRVLHQLHGTIVPAAAKIAGHRRVLAEYDAWCAANPGLPPDEERGARVLAAQKALREAGLLGDG